MDKQVSLWGLSEFFMKYKGAHEVGSEKYAVHREDIGREEMGKGIRLDKDIICMYEILKQSKHMQTNKLIKSETIRNFQVWNKSRSQWYSSHLTKEFLFYKQIS